MSEVSTGQEDDSIIRQFWRMWRRQQNGPVSEKDLNTEIEGAEQMKNNGDKPLVKPPLSKGYGREGD